MPWSGGGVWSPVYTWVVEANNGVKILAAHQDTQWADLASSLGNVWTLDGQTKPTANFNMNGFKLTGLVDGSSAQDSATVGQVSRLANEWIPETVAVAFVNTTSFKVTGVDATARYPKGQRIKVVHNGGATTSYYVVTSSSFAVDTTVNVSQGANLVSTISSVSYSFDNASNWSIPWGTSIAVQSSQVARNSTSGSSYLLGDNAGIFPSTTVDGDLFSNWVNNGTLQSPPAGWYLIAANASLLRNGATITSDAFISTTSTLGGGFNLSFGIPTFSGGQSIIASCCAVVRADPTHPISVSLQVPTFTGGPVQGFGASVTFLRVR